MTNAARAQNDGPQVRTMLYERDAETQAQSLLDIRECNLPTKSESGSWTALTKDADAVKRALLLDLSRQVDRLVAGEIDEIKIFIAG